MKIDSRIEPAKLLVTLLRMTIGWHFLFEGLSKLFINGWTSYSFLANSTGPLSDFYHWISSTALFLKVVDLTNIFALILIGGCLFTGLFTTLSSAAGFLLLVFYYFAYPPFGGTLLSPNEGHLFIVDRNFIEGIALLYIAFIKDKGYGIDNLIKLTIKGFKWKKSFISDKETHSESRRELIKNLASIPVLGLMGWGSFQHTRRYGLDVRSGATLEQNPISLKDLKGILPKGKIGNHEISRLVLGGNLIRGSAHARDLIYVNSLLHAYNTEKKIYETLILAEKAGINTINIRFDATEIIANYRKITGSKIKVISFVGPGPGEKDDYLGQINYSIDNGADILQVAGYYSDWMVRDKKTDVIMEMLEVIKSKGFTAGLGAHTIDALIVCEENGIRPDYYMKAMHHDKYWSAHPTENRIAFEVDGEKHLDHNRFHDNIFDLYPDRTIEFINRSKIPVMGYKVLAAGAIYPEDGFRWAFENGADFICVGMLDYQVVNNVNICIDILGNLKNRKRLLFG